MKHLLGARSTPAPTMPMPGSLCAMPVFSRGRMPVSATLRTSIASGVPRKFSGGMVKWWCSATQISYMETKTAGDGAHLLRLLAIPGRERLRRVLRFMLDESEFLSPYGLRSLSRFHKDHPYRFQLDGEEYRVEYVPGESNSDLFGGNSNWRGPVWFPVNYLLIESLERYHHFYGDSFQIECPSGSGRMMTLGQVARMPLNWLSELAGSAARPLRDFACNIDDRPVIATPTDALSYSHQETFDEDTTDAAFVGATLCKLADQAFVRARADGKQIRTVTVKIRYTDMDEHQGQMSLPEPTDVETHVYPLLSRLLDRLWDRRVRIRMVQVRFSNVYRGFSQLDLFGIKQKQRDLAVACEAIRDRFGPRALMRLHDWKLESNQSSVVSYQ